MIWFGLFLSVVALSLLGLLCAGYLANTCLDWYRISSFEGKSGYFVVSMALLGAILSLIVSIVTLTIVSPDDGLQVLQTFGAISLGELVFSIILYPILWYQADLPPTLHGKELLVEIEILFPIGMNLDRAIEATESSSLRLLSVRGKTVRKTEHGELQFAKARFENGRWIVPGSVLLFTRQGARVLALEINGESLIGYQLPLPSNPGEKHLQWSAWGPQLQPPAPAWPDSNPSYRFRLQQVET